MYTGTMESKNHQPYEVIALHMPDIAFDLLRIVGSAKSSTHNRIGERSAGDTEAIDRQATVPNTW